MQSLQRGEGEIVLKHCAKLLLVPCRITGGLFPGLVMQFASKSECKALLIDAGAISFEKVIR